MTQHASGVTLGGTVAETVCVTPVVAATRLWMATPVAEPPASTHLGHKKNAVHVQSAG